jgi:hypothetical protein
MPITIYWGSGIANRLRYTAFAIDSSFKDIVKGTAERAHPMAVLGVESTSKDVKDFMVKRLNYYQLDYDFADKLKVYSVPVTIVSE